MLSRILRSLTDVSALEPLEPRALLAADIGISVGTLSTGPDRNTVPSIKLPVTIFNNGTTIFKGGGNIEYYLSSDRVLDDSDFKFASTPLPKSTGSLGKTTLNVPKPALLAPPVGRAVPAGNYFVIAKIVPKNPGADSNPSNDVAASTTTLPITYQFGNVGNHPNVPLKVTLPNGATATIYLDGPGTGQALNVDNQVVLIIDGSTTQSRLRIVPSKGPTPEIHSVTVNSGLSFNNGLKEFNAPNVTFTGDINIQGAVGKFEAGDVRNSNISISGFGANVSVRMRNVTNSSLTSNIPFRDLTVKSWRDTDATQDLVRVAYMDTLQSDGEFGASITTTRTNNGYAIKTVSIRGAANTGTWDISGDVYSIRLGSTGDAWRANIVGVLADLNVGGSAHGTLAASVNITRIRVGGNLTNMTIFAGTDLGSDAALGGTGTAADTFGSGSIGRVEVRGSMTNSNVAAGMRTTDNIIGNEDDEFASNAVIQFISVNHTMTNSHFLAHGLPTKAYINFKQIPTANDPRFISGATTSG